MGYYINYRETLVTYLRSESIEEAAKNLNVPIATLKSRLTTMKAAGVKVPSKTGMAETLKSDLFVAQLNSLVSKYNKEK